MARQTSSLKRNRRIEERIAYLFIAPVLLGILIFQVYPTVFSLYTSFTTWNLITPQRWVGLENYINLFTTDRFFFKTMGNTASYTLGVVLPSMAIALFFASLLNQSIRYKHLYRAIYFVPCRRPTVALAILWGWLYEPNFGIINSVLRLVGIKGPAWLGTTQWALRSVIMMAIWAGVGFQIVIFLAGLQACPKNIMRPQTWMVRTPGRSSGASPCRCFRPSPSSCWSQASSAHSRISRWCMC